MSTVTKIKGTFDNDKLPVLTSEGLKNYYYGKYINGLAGQGYTLTVSQKTAVENFINFLTENNLIKYIQTIFPFIGNSANPKGAKVPMIGDKLLDFADNYDGLVYDSTDIIGINKNPKVDTLKLGDVQPDKNLVGAAFSLNKKSTSGATDYNDRFMLFSDSAYNLRLQSGNPVSAHVTDKFCMYYRLASSGNSGTSVINDGYTDAQREAAGSWYGMNIFKNPAGYCRVFDIGGVVKGADSTTYSTYAPALTDADLQSTLIANTTFTNINALTSITFFKDIMTYDEGVAYISALKTFITALGRHV